MENNNKKQKKKRTGIGGEKNNPLGVARRSVWYILRVVLIITACITLCYLALVEAMYVSNIYIITTEGMELRADCILGTKSPGDLKEHFDKGWLMNDYELSAGKYDAYRVDSYDYRYDIEKLRVMPWSKEATVQFVERVVNIVAVSYTDDNTEPAPEWVDSRMEITLEKIDGRWYITNIEVLELAPEAEPRPTPDYDELETNIPHY